MVVMDRSKTSWCFEFLFLDRTEVPCALIRLFYENFYHANTFSNSGTDVSSTYNMTNLYAATIQIPGMTQPLYLAMYNGNIIMATDAELSIGATILGVEFYLPLQGTSPNLVPLYFMWPTATDPVGSILLPYIKVGWIVKSTLYAFVGTPGAPKYNTTCSFLSGT